MNKNKLQKDVGETYVFMWTISFNSFDIFEDRLKCSQDFMSDWMCQRLKLIPKH